MITDRIIDKKVKGILEKAGAQIGLRYNEETHSLLGVYNGYHISCAYINNVYDIKVSVRKDGQLPEEAFCKNIKNSIREIWKVKVRDNVVIANPTGATTGRTIKAIVATIKGLTEAFRMNGFEDVCECCGKPHTYMNNYYIKGEITTLCDDCYNGINQAIQQSVIEQENITENIVAGLVGAFLGSLIGVLCIVLVGQLGYVASMSGVVMAVCTAVGYELFAKKLSIKGIVVSAIMMIVMSFFATKVSWCVSIVRSTGYSFFDVYSSFWNLLDYARANSDFYSNLSGVYIYELIGAVPTFYGIIKNQKTATEAHKIQEEM